MLPGARRAGRETVGEIDFRTRSGAVTTPVVRAKPSSTTDFANSINKGTKSAFADSMRDAVVVFR
jgi:hypothetical protein